MVFLGASSVSAATATCQESLDLSSSQEAMRGEGFGETETLLGAGAWAPREGARLGLLVSVPRPLWPRPAVPGSLQVQVRPLPSVWPPGPTRRPLWIMPLGSLCFCSCSTFPLSGSCCLLPQREDLRL